MSVSVYGSGASFAVGTPHALFDLQAWPRAYVGFYPGGAYDAAADGQHFLINSMTGMNAAPPPITIAVNWTSLLARR